MAKVQTLEFTEVKTKLGATCKMLLMLEESVKNVQFLNQKGEPMVDFMYQSILGQSERLKVTLMTRKPVFFANLEGEDKTFETFVELFSTLDDMIQPQKSDTLDLRNDLKFNFVNGDDNRTLKTLLKAGSIGVHKAAHYE
jgi:hypothetical protein